MNKIAFVQRLFAAEDRVVQYSSKAKALCPVCQFLGLPPGKIVIYKTIGEVRYCCCDQCSANFRAVGPTPAEIRAARQAEEAAAIEAEKHVRQTKLNKFATKKQAKEKTKQQRKK